MRPVLACLMSGLCAAALPLSLPAAASPYAIDRLVGTDSAMHQLVAEAPDCPGVPAPVVSLDSESRYDPQDRKSVEIDAARSRKYRETVQPVRDYLQLVSATANKSIEFPFARRAWALCTLSLLDGWASAGGLTRMETRTAKLLRGSQVATLSLAALQIRDAVSDDPRMARVADWLAGLAYQSRDFVASRPNATSTRANHRYWNGLGAAAAGLLAEDETLIDWGIDSARVGLAQVDEAGFLPLELNRERRARNYHLYAIAPLMMTAEIAAATGVDLYGEADGALPRLARAVIASLADPAAMAEAAKAEQLPLKHGVLPQANRLAWLEPYAARTGDPAARALLEQVRPVSFSGIGGNMTLLFSKGAVNGSE